MCRSVTVYLNSYSVCFTVVGSSQIFFKMTAENVSVENDLPSTNVPDWKRLLPLAVSWRHLLLNTVHKRWNFSFPLFLFPPLKRLSVLLLAKEQQTGSNRAKWEQSVRSLPLIPTQPCLKGPVWQSGELCQVNGALCHVKQAKRCSASLCSAVLESGPQAINVPTTLCVCVCVRGGGLTLLYVYMNVCAFVLIAVGVCMLIGARVCMCFTPGGQTLKSVKDTFSKATRNVHVSLHQTHAHTHTHAQIPFPNHSSDNRHFDWFSLNQN